MFGGRARTAPPSRAEVGAARPPRTAARHRAGRAGAHGRRRRRRGRSGRRAPLGGVGLGNALFMAIGVLGMGVMLGLDPLISQALGAGDRRRARRAVWQGHLARRSGSSAALALPMALGAGPARALGIERRRRARGEPVPGLAPPGPPVLLPSSRRALVSPGTGLPAADGRRDRSSRTSSNVRSTSCWSSGARALPAWSRSAPRRAGHRRGRLGQCQQRGLAWCRS